MKKAILLLAAITLMGCEEKDDCIVTGNKLGSMGKPVAFEHEGKKYWVCCSPCIKKFKKNPERYLNEE